MTLETFFQKFDLFADAPDALAKMRGLVLELAVRGSLVPHSAVEPAVPYASVEAATPINASDVPENWRVVLLSDAIKNRSGNSKLIKGKLHDEPAAGRFQGFSASGADVWCDDFEHEGEAIIISAVGARCGKAFKASGKWSAIANTNITRPVPSLFDFDFAYLVLNNEHFWVRGGSAQPFVKFPPSLDRYFAFPPLAEQKRIVAKVDELMALCDDLESEQRERETQHEGLARASLSRFSDAPTLANLEFLFHKSYDISPGDLRKFILTLAVQGKLVPQDPNDEGVRSGAEFRKAVGELADFLGLRSPKEAVDEVEPPFDAPAHWSWMPLADIGAAQTGTTPSKADPSAFNGEIPFIKPADILPNSVDYSNESLTRIGAENGSRLAPAGSLLMVCIGTIGKCNLIDRECAFNQQINSLSPVQWIEPRYLLTAARARYFHDAAWAKSSSTTIAILNKGKWLSIPIPVPPLAEQRRIVAKVDELMALVDALETQLATARTAATDLLTAAVAELTNGKEHDALVEV
ncbi:MAG: restriction endonuclease subunit S [Terrimicrobiaceae bacterium]|nr:restriction endonuclease subunit S [Terrimicrobiaceae bacterium]